MAMLVVFLVVPIFAIAFAVITRPIYVDRLVPAFGYNDDPWTFHVPDRWVIIVGLAIDDTRHPDGNIDIDSGHRG
jgi:hypothetical protein